MSDEIKYVKRYENLIAIGLIVEASLHSDLAMPSGRG